MTQQAELLKKIDALPPKYFGEVIDFIGYLQHKAQQEVALQAADTKEQRAAREKAAFTKYAEKLNAEAEDVLLYQDLDSFEEDLKRFTSQELAVLHDTTVPFSPADLVRIV